MNIDLHKDVFETDIYTEIYETLLNETTWGLIGHSVEGSRKFWFMDLSETNMKEMFYGSLDFLEDYDLERIYANGQISGQDGYPHKDSQDDDTMTLMYYPMPKWDISWGGETVFFDENNEMFLSFLPKPNSALFFNSNILHFGRSPSGNCDEFRITIALKLKRRSG